MLNKFKKENVKTNLELVKELKKNKLFNIHNNPMLNNLDFKNQELFDLVMQKFCKRSKITTGKILDVDDSNIDYKEAIKTNLIQ